MSGDTKPEVVIVLGFPGAGKGTQCEKIAQEFGYVHLSAGQLLRDERQKKSEYSKLINEHFCTGTIVCAEITCSLLEKAMRRSTTSRFLIDGFPPNVENLNCWNKTMSSKVKLQFVLFFDCTESQKVCVERCLGRGRSDDNVESLKKRLRIYREDTISVIEYYRALNLVQQVDASKSTDEVFKEVKKYFHHQINFHTSQ